MSSLGIKAASLRCHTPPALPLFLLGLLLPTLPNASHRLLGQVLPEHALNDLLLARPSVANHDEDTSRNIHYYGAAEDGGSNGHRAHAVVDDPGAEAQCELKARVQVEQHDNGDKEAQRKRVVRLRFVRFVKSMGLGEALLVVFKSTLLLRSQDRHLLFGIVEGRFEVHVGLIRLVRLYSLRREVVLVF